VETGLFWTVLHNPKLYLCPMDNPAALVDGARPQQISSYAMNGAVVGYPGISVDISTITPVKLQRMQADDCAFWETDERTRLTSTTGPITRRRVSAPGISKAPSRARLAARSATSNSRIGITT
jgi:hypothetical protein